MFCNFFMAAAIGSSRSVAYLSMPVITVMYIAASAKSFLKSRTFTPAMFDGRQVLTRFPQPNTGLWWRGWRNFSVRLGCADNDGTFFWIGIVELGGLRIQKQQRRQNLTNIDHRHRLFTGSAEGMKFLGLPSLPLLAHTAHHSRQNNTTVRHVG